MKTGWKILICALLVVTGMYFMPFVTSSTTDSEGRSWVVPFGSSYLDATENTVSFTNPRSAYATSKDAKNAVESYEEKECYGLTYYYDKANDVSLSGYAVESGMPSRITYTFENGDACKGWTVDDEVAWEIGDIEEAAALKSEDALKAGYVVVVDGEVQNMPEYYDFSRMVKQGLYCIKRTAIYEGNTLIRIIDVQQMSDAKIRVTTFENGKKNVETFGRFTESEVDGKMFACVYRGLDKNEAPTPLYPCK